MKNTQNIRLSVDAVVFGYSKDTGVSVLLIRRKFKPFQDSWAIPGGFVLENESLEDAYLKVYEGYGKPDEKLGAVTSGDANVPQKERDAAGERLLAKAKAKREKNK